MNNDRSNDRWKKFFAGLFFLCGLVLIGFVIFILGQSKGLTQSRFQIQVLFDDIGGMVEGVPVRLAGVNVGHVGDISFLDETVAGRRVQVQVFIYEEYRRQFNKNVRFSIKPEGILGEKLIEIAVFEQGPPVDLNQPILGERTIGVQAVAEAFAEAARSFTETSDQFKNIDVQGLSHVLQETTVALQTTTQSVQVVFEELTYMLRKGKRLIDRLEQQVIDGNLFKVF